MDEEKEAVLGEGELSDEVKELLDPARTAVLLIDIQKGYFDADSNLAKELMSGTEDLQSIVPRIKEFSDFARSMGLPIIWTRMIENAEQSAMPVRMKMRTSGYSSVTIPGSESFEYFGIKPQEGDIEITKKNFDAFTEEELVKVLKEKGITTLVVVGANTGVCVESTVRSAQSRDYFVFVPRDLVGEPDIYRERGEKTLESIDLLFGWVTKSDTINDVWREQLTLK